MGKNEDKSKDIVINPSEIADAGYVRLPLNEHQFKGFINSLLGSPQAINGTTRKPFEIGIGEIRHLNDLIVQRVSQQNNGVQARFLATITYSDESSIEINTIEDLISLNQLKPIYSTNINLLWDFIVQFPSKNFPEKQTIEISFNTSPMLGFDIDDEPIFTSYDYSEFGRGHITYRIEYTARSWGIDIESLLQNYLKSITKKVSPLKAFIRRNRFPVSLIVSLMLFLSSLFGSYFVVKQFNTSMQTDLSNLIAQPANELETIGTKLQFLIQYVVSGKSSELSMATNIFGIVFMLLSAGVFFWLQAAASGYEPSFILLTNETIKLKDSTLVKLQRKWLSFILGVLLSIITGILSNILFLYFFS